MLGLSYRRGDPLPAEAIRAALARICGCEPFRSSPRLIAFLRFIVDAALAGDGVSLKAYTIAVGALGRPESFDPSRDAIVRVEALRLRAALEHYYGSEGADEQIVIALRRGSYVPEFGWRDAAATAPHPAEGQHTLDASFESAALTIPTRHSVVEERRAVFAQCHAHLAKVSGTIDSLKAEFAVAETILAHSQRLIALSRRKQGAELAQVESASD